MRQWSAKIKNFYKGRYYNNEQILSVKAGRIHTAVHKAVTRYVANLPRGTRISGLSIKIEAIRVKKPKHDPKDLDFDLLKDIFSVPVRPKKANPRQRDLERLINKP